MFNLLYHSLQRLTENGSPPFDLALRCISSGPRLSEIAISIRSISLR